MYENTGSTLDRDYSWNIEVNWPYSCALGDVDQDGWLDVAIASYYEKVYLVRNEEGVLANDFLWESSDVRQSYRCDWGDMDNDTFPELAVANYNTTSHPGNNVVYANEIMKPTVTILYPEEGQEVRGRVTINGMANGTMEFDLDRVEVSLDNGSSWIGAVGTDEWSYQWNSFEWEDGEYAIMTRAIAGPLVSEHAVVNVTLDNPENRAPTLEFISPPAGGDTADMSYIIQWIVQDEDGDTISMDLYYDEDSDSGNGKELLASLEGDVDEYVWDTRETAEGEYYISIVADDKNGSVVERYSQGTIRVEHISSSNHDPEIEIVSITNLQDGFMGIRWEATDADEDELLIDISYDDDTKFGNGADLIVADIENVGEYDLDTTDIPEGDHYFVLVARDPNGGTAVAYSEQFHVNETRVVPEFSVVELEILPAGAVFTAGDLVTIQAVVTNTKDVDGQGQVSLIVDNVTVQTKTEMIRYDQQVTVLFMWTAVEGNHTITVLVDFPDDPTYRPHGLSTWVLVGTADQVGDGDDDDEITTLLIGSTIGVIAVVVLVVFFVVSRRSEHENVRCPRCGENTTYYREYDDHYCDGCEEYTSEMNE